METKATANGQAGKISNVGILDFTGMKSEAELSKITEIEQVGVILVPESLQSALICIAQTNVGAIVPIPEGDKVRLQAGQIEISGESFANGEEDVVLVVAGQLIITSQVTKISFKKVVVVGQVLAPKGSESALGTAISVLGQIVYYAGENPRMFMGNDTLAKDFFELLEKPIFIFVVGMMHLEPDVTVQLLKEKVTGIAVIGKLVVPKALSAMAQVLTTLKVGEIEIGK